MGLGLAIQREIEESYLPVRLCKSVNSVIQKKGCLTGSAMISTMIAVKAFVLTFSYFCMEGVVRSFMAVAVDEYDDKIVSLRPLGDAGGWTALALFSMTAAGNLTMKLIREGEYIRVQSICKKWMKDHQELIQENPKPYEKLYLTIQDILYDYSTQCLFSKSLLSRKLTALKIHEPSKINVEDPPFSKDKNLEPFFHKIQLKLQKKSSSKQYFQRFFYGQRSVMRHGCSRELNSLIFGIAIPIILLGTALLSFVGQIGLAKQLFYDREELTDVGHFGEWPFNAVEAIGVAIFLHFLCILNEGDFERTRMVYAKQIDKLKDEPDLHNHLCKVANKDLSQQASGCNYFKLNYQFKKI